MKTSAFLSSVALLVVGVGACSSSSTNTGPTDASGSDASLDVPGPGACNIILDCPGAADAACPTVCQDGSNPCLYSCVDHACVQHGCPGDVVDASLGDTVVAETDQSDVAPTEVSTVGGTTTCDPACPGGSTCVKLQPNDEGMPPPNEAGVCPTGFHLVGAACIANPTFECATTPAVCAGALSCGCAGSLCGSYVCISVTANQVNCVTSLM